MFQKLVVINAQHHANTKLKQIESFGFASKFHVASVMAHEFARASAIFPIVFLEDKEKDEFIPLVLMGIEAGENLFVDANGKWLASYIPAIIRRYPFALTRSNEEGQFMVCIDEGSDLLSTTEGNPLFSENGSPSQLLENVKRYLGELQQMELFTRNFCRFLTEHNLFAPLNMRVRAADQVRSISGCYVINEDRLNNLSDERFLEIHKKRYLPVIYSHLNSLGQIDRLISLKDGKNNVNMERTLR